MESKAVGAAILNIITESLYDQPIVVFREYVQNSVDSFAKKNTSKIHNELCSKIWMDNGNLYFLDNGNGIKKEEFFLTMHRIAGSNKRKSVDMGYKGIGRLSGVPYCEKLIFINICSYKNKVYQRFSIDGEKYNSIKKNNYEDMTIQELMEKISSSDDRIEGNDAENIFNLLKEKENIFKNIDTGFFVILENVRQVLLETIKNDDFLMDLSWLLPVKFKDELLDPSHYEHQLFKELMGEDENKIIPAISYNIYYNNNLLERPIKYDMLRKFTCRFNMEYATGFITFLNDDKIMIMKGNQFSGIKIYIDNMLLCDETELIPALVKYGYLKNSTYEMLQTVKGIGAMIYITDKINISANARRTFIEITDQDALDFLDLLGGFVQNIFDARYALSKYNVAKNKSVNHVKENEQEYAKGKEKVEELKEKALNALRSMGKETITINDKVSDADKFEDLTTSEQKQFIKKEITGKINAEIKNYLSQVSTFDYDNAYDDFLKWLYAH